jgi:hypothetical protein
LHFAEVGDRRKASSEIIEDDKHAAFPKGGQVSPGSVEVGEDCRLGNFNLKSTRIEPTATD